MLCMLVAYDAAGNVVATLDYMAARDGEGQVVGLIDFAAHEAAGGKLRDIWDNDRAVGSGTWPEWLGSQAHSFQVEVGSDKRIVALIHKESGVRRDRDAIEAAIKDRIAASGNMPADIRDLVGGPDMPLELDEAGITIGRNSATKLVPRTLPMIRKSGPP